MYDEVNTKCNLPAQIDIEATEGMEYKFLCVTKGGGSANKTYLYQETKAVLNPATLVPFMIEKMKSLGTASRPRASAPADFSSLAATVLHTTQLQACGTSPRPSRFEES